MGQFEKVVVLIVFFLVTVIFVVTLNPTDKEGPVFDMGAKEVLAESPATGQAAPVDLGVSDGGAGQNPRTVESDRGGPTKVDPQPASGLTLQERIERGKRNEEKAADPSLLLDAGGSGSTSMRQLPKGAALITLEGLEDTWDDNFKEYTWKKGDSFVGLAERLYGDRAKSALLRRMCEGVTYVPPGDKILVPVFDQSGGDLAVEGSDSRTDDSASKPAVTGAGGSYKVIDGDSLWVISKKVYGKGSRWEEIYEANRDLLDSPDDVAVDMVLRIP
jgi:nucleoid-associated protein YgaU